MLSIFILSISWLVHLFLRRFFLTAILEMKRIEPTVNKSQTNDDGAN